MSSSEEGDGALPPYPRAAVVTVLVAITILVTCYVALVAPGVPYDEPAHWADVVHVADHGSFPVLGRGDATYEAQQGPVAYYLYAAVLVLVRAAGLSDQSGFYAARLLGIPVLAALFLLVLSLVRRSVPSLPPAVAVVGAAVATVNPMVVAMCASIQNDSLALVLALAALRLALPPPVGRPAVLQALATGALVGLAVVTKLTAWPVVVVLLVVWLRRRQAGAAVAFLGSAAVAGGWWFVRNAVLYGDLTGQKGVVAAGYSFPAAPLRDVSDGVHIARGVLTYLWLPTEYFRNLIAAPTVLQGAVVLVTAGVALLAVVRRAALGRPGAVAAVAALAVVGWVLTDVTNQATAPRIAACALAGWACLVSAASSRPGGRTSQAVAAAGLAGLHVFVLVAVAGLGYRGIAF